MYCPNGGVSASWDHLCLILLILCNLILDPCHYINNSYPEWLVADLFENIQNRCNTI